jgi:Flp pilus assembly pilin Flp
MIELLRSIWRADEAQDLVEYALLVALLSTAVVAVLSSFTGSVSTVFSEAISAM